MNIIKTGTFNEQGEISVTNNYDYSNKIKQLTTKEKKYYLDKAKSLDVNNIGTINDYGSDLSNIIANNGDNLLNAVRGTNSSEIVALTNDLLAQLDMIDIDELKNDSVFLNIIKNIPIIKYLVRSTKKFLVKYDTVKNNVNKISVKIDQSKMVALRDNNMLSEIFTNNVQYIQQLRDLIIGAKLKQEENMKLLVDYKVHLTLHEEYEIQDLQNFITRLDKKISDMQISEYILSQNLLQIRATQINNVAIMDKADNITAHILPLWKNQIALAIIMNNQKNSIAAQRKVSDMTNKILVENSKLLHSNSVNVAKESERAVVSISTLKSTTDELIKTIKEVNEIHKNGIKERKQIESNLQQFALQISESLKQ